MAMSPEEYKARHILEQNIAANYPVGTPKKGAQNAQAVHDTMMKKALKQVGFPPDSIHPVQASEIFAETIKWHLATVKVFEYMQAQLNFDPFKSDPEAKKIFERILLGGYLQLQNEASGTFK